MFGRAFAAQEGDQIALKRVDLDCFRQLGAEIFPEIAPGIGLGKCDQFCLHRRGIGAPLLGDDPGGRLALTLLTFGFKNGPPRDSDLTLDVRFLPNPHYVDELRPLTGLDESVREYVESGTQAGEFYGRLGAQVKFNQTWGLNGEVKFVDGYTEYFVGPRVSF